MLRRVSGSKYDIYDSDRRRENVGEREKEREREKANCLLAATQRALLDKSFEETRHKYI